MHVAVLGAGTMGRGIAQVTAVAGHRVTMRDVDEDLAESGRSAVASSLETAIDRGVHDRETVEAALDRLSATVDLAEAVAGADLVVEAVPEDLDLKRETFESVEDHAPAEAVIATNTSSLSVTEIAAALDRPGRAIGLHFFNPVYAMDLVEVVVPRTTDAETVAFARDYVAGIGKEAVEVRDSAGFATSRLGVALGLEATRMLEEGVAAPPDLDRAMELGYDHPVGPIELGDRVGLDVRLDIAEYLREQLGERFRPPQLLRQKVRAGDLGQKTGRGFYVWEDGEPVETADDWGDRR